MKEPFTGELGHFPFRESARLISFSCGKARKDARVGERLRAQYAAVWEAGFEAAQTEYLTQKRDPAHPFTRKNPWKKDR